MGRSATPNPAEHAPQIPQVERRLRNWRASQELAAAERAAGLPWYDERFLPPVLDCDLPVRPSRWADCQHRTKVLGAHMRAHNSWADSAGARHAMRQRMAAVFDRILPSAGPYMDARGLSAEKRSKELAALKLIPDRLRYARMCGEYLFRPDDCRIIRQWETKAELPLHCSDDSREETIRITERYLAECMRPGTELHYMVFTWPNVAPGSLEAAQRAMFRDVVHTLRTLPNMLGALLVMESPLSARRDWNVHINVMLVADKTVRPGQRWAVDYRDVRADFGFNVHMQPIFGTAQAVRRAFLELIKYAARTVADKSTAHAALSGATASSCDQADDVRQPAPAIEDWTDAEVLEWHLAQRHFRRTRSYDALHGIAKPEPLPLEGFERIGWFAMRGGRYVVLAAGSDSALVDWILENNFRTAPADERMRGSSHKPRGPPD